MAIPTDISNLDDRSEWTPDPTFRINTPRLFLSHCSPDNPEDIDFFITLSSLLSVTGEGTSREDMRTLMRQRNAQALRFSWPGWFRVTLKETGTLIGKCTLVRPRPCPEELWWPAPDIGFTFLPEARGKGYATEAAKALIAWAQETQDVKEVLGFCAASNEKSQKALQRLGLVKWGQGKISMLNLEDSETMVFGPPGRTSLEGYVDQNKIQRLYLEAKNDQKRNIHLYRILYCDSSPDFFSETPHGIEKYDSQFWRATMDYSCRKK